MNTFKNNLHGRCAFNILIAAFIYSYAFRRSISSALPSPVSAAVSTQHETPNVSETNSNTVNMTALMAANQSNIVIVKDLAALHRMFPSIASNSTSNSPQRLPHRARGLRAAATCIKRWAINKDDDRIPKLIWSAVCNSLSPCAVKCVPVKALKEVRVITFMGYLDGYEVFQLKRRDFHYIKDCRCQSYLNSTRNPVRLR